MVSNSNWMTKLHPDTSQHVWLDKSEEKNASLCESDHKAKCINIQKQSELICILFVMVIRLEKSGEV